MTEVSFKLVPGSEKDLFTQYFQAYLGELAALNKARPNRRGLYEYGLYDFYWLDSRFMPFFVEHRCKRVGLLMLREMTEHDSITGQPSVQVAEICVFRPYRRQGIAREAMRFAARTAEERGLPLTWSAYMNNDAANALYRFILDEFADKDGAWETGFSRGLDPGGLARFYYQMTPATARRAIRGVALS